MRRETSGLNVCNPELFGQKKNWWKFFWKIPFFLWAIYFRNISFIYNKKKLFFITQIFDNFFPGLNSGILFVQTNKQKRNQIKRWKHLFFTPTIFSHPLLDNVCSNTPMTIDDNNNLVQTNKHLEQTHTHTHETQSILVRNEKKIRFNDTMVMLEQQQKTIIQNQNFILISLLSTIFFRCCNEWKKTGRKLFFFSPSVCKCYNLNFHHTQTNKQPQQRPNGKNSFACLFSCAESVYLFNTMMTTNTTNIHK